MKTRIFIAILSAGALCLGMTSNVQGAKPEPDDEEVQPGENQAMKKMDNINPAVNPKGQHPGAGHKPKDKAKQMAVGIANNGGKALPPGLAKKAARGEMLPPPWRTGVFLPPGQAKKQGGGLPPGIAKKVANGKPLPPGQAKKMGGGAQGFAGKKQGKGEKPEEEEKEEEKDKDKKIND